MLCFPRLGDYGYLGNAMFQYASLLGIADKNNYTAKYDYDKVGTMATLHDVFNITKLENMPVSEQVHSIGRIWKEPNFHFCEEAFNLKDNSGLFGYFQSEKYFKHIESDIRSEFTFSEEVQKECDSKIEEIKNKTDNGTITSVHVRLGDYKMLEHVFVPLIKTEYYQHALSASSQEKENTTILIFSNEIEMCKNLFQGPNCVFAEGGSTEQDMCLMSKCDNNVIANSSFSWWAAWLNENKDKRVIAPKNWFVPEQKEPKDPKDLYCEGWTVI